MATTTKFNGTGIKGKTKDDIQKVTSMMVDIIRRSKTIWRKEIKDWQRARALRHSVDFPQTYLLHNVYDDAMLDGHLTGITENRTLRSINKNFAIFDPDEKVDEELTKFIKRKTWFRKALQMAHESTYHGTTLIWLKKVENNEIKEVKLIERGLVIPDLSLIVNDINMQSGLDYTEFPDVLLPAQMYSSVGLLEKAVPYTILKRHSWGSWDEFEELFGIPIRIAKIASQSETVKKEVAGWLEEMGSAAYGVFPIGTEVEIKENSKADAFNVFFQKIKALDAELSKLVLHQTMTTDSGSSKSQSEVHLDTLQELVYADEQNLLSFLNDYLLPAMRVHGYPIPEGYTIGVTQTLDAGQQIKVDGVLMQNGFLPTKEYVERVYGMEVGVVPDGKSKPKPVEPEKVEEPEEEELGNA
jgi:hypothetical protein